ncbi:CDC48 family AAA ATPase [Marinisporobacter balticus]|uniref:Transitional endoplasmic reticulum ATPase n=1 Tax=Marinisporobacter balticus TaxID=2018667 RepID=A0A4V2SBZ0_9FIRM|nr:CDC48 family AAA ATPase [Marinisporobacter balticus]TCO77370.1 transitional endoplasmic reticulum ATPase [Marinisporobacter balticus]
MVDVYIDQENKISLSVLEAESKDVGRGIARMDSEDMIRLGADVGDIILISGQKDTAAKLLPVHKEYRGKSIIQMDGIIRENAGVGIDDKVIVKKSSYSQARSVTLCPITDGSDVSEEWDTEYIRKLLEELPTMEGNLVRVTLFGSRYMDFSITKTSPEGIVLIYPGTILEIVSSTGGRDGRYRISYEDIGGLHTKIQRVREMIELPLRYPEIFERLGILPPNGVLLYGPPGTGKTLIARAVATETDAHFIAVNGPEIIHKFYGESEAKLRSVFEEAASRAPTIIFIDEIDAIAPKRNEVSGEVEKRVVGQLLALMDGLEKRKHVVVIGATNIPNALDPALRRPGRFDREISISVPDKDGRAEILEIHTRGMPLAEDVDLVRLAERTHGFVGADLEALCREAGMCAIREVLPEIDYDKDFIPYDILLVLKVRMDHFTCAMGEVEPSAIREVFVEIPNVRWDDIGGLSEIKVALQRAIEWPLKYSALFNHVKAHNPKGILLTGLPGTGKTLIAKAVASESNANFISIKGPALFSKWVGESEKRIREVFKKAKQAAPCIIFFDEIDALSYERASDGSDSSVGQRVVCQLLTELDGVEELKGVVVLAATNRIDLVDSAFLRQGRFDQIFQILEPNEQERYQIFKIHLKGRPLADGVNLEELAHHTDGLVGSDIYGICEQAAMRAIERFLTSDEDCLERLKIDAEDIHWATNEVIRMKKISGKQ